MILPQKNYLIYWNKDKLPYYALWGYLILLHFILEDRGD